MIDKEKKHSISEVSKITGYETHVLRYYESDFNLEIPRTKSKRRYYTHKEIEKFIYIKELQEKGLTNKQIKLVLESPELIVSEKEVAVAKAEDISVKEVAVPETEDISVLQNNNQVDAIEMICSRINESINLNINYKLDETKNEIIEYFDENVKEDEENTTLVKKEKDVLICENARLKMKVKEKSYEVAELKERLNRLEHKNTPFWKKLFKK